MAQTKPKRLREGARIGVVSPSFHLPPDRLAKAAAVFKHRGFDLLLGKSASLQQHRYSGHPQDRAEDINNMFADSSIDAIICARGGYGTNRVSPLLDYELIRANPKIFVGYSDATGLLTTFAQRCGLVCFHGPMLTTFTGEVVPFNLEKLIEVLSGNSNIRIDSPAECKARVLRSGNARGPAWGGNLSLIVERLGTQEQVDTSGAVLFLEEVGERYHVFDRMLMQLKNSGGLENINALVVGELTEMTDSDPSFGKSLDEIVLDVCSDYSFPIVANFPCGHGSHQATIPVSHEIEVDASTDNPAVLIPESAVL